MEDILLADKIPFKWGMTLYWGHPSNIHEIVTNPDIHEIRYQKGSKYINAYLVHKEVPHIEYLGMDVKYISKVRMLKLCYSSKISLASHRIPLGASDLNDLSRKLHKAVILHGNPNSEILALLERVIADTSQISKILEA